MTHWSNTEYTKELEEIKQLVDKPQLYDFIKNNVKNFDFATISYLTMMSHRLYYMHKVLKDTGSFYLHCDPTMSHYLKILLDIVFERKNFRNEVIWCYDKWIAPSKNFQRNHDVIFKYSKTDNFNYNVIREIDDKRNITLDRGYTTNLLKNGERQLIVYKGSENKENIKKLIKSKKFTRIIYKEPVGNPIKDYWNINIIHPKAKERLGYPTQKPLELLKRIILASSNEGDYIADFFCGCGTTISAAEQLNRKWFGVDISHLAITLIEDRFKKEDLKPIYEVNGFPKDIAGAEKLSQLDKFKFEEWIVEYVFKGHQTKKTGDGGFDGHIVYNLHNQGKVVSLRSIIEVKGGNVNIGQIRAFKDTIQTYNADFGIFVAFGKYITDGMKKEANELGSIELNNMDLVSTKYKPKKMYIITIDDIFNNKLPVELTQMTTNITY